jgi:hypothetical protein
MRCSMVEILVSPEVRQVDNEVSPTFSAEAFISTTGSKSTLLKIIPVSVGAGRIFNMIGFPVCRPTPKP